MGGAEGGVVVDVFLRGFVPVEGLRGENPVLSKSRVPQRDVIGDVADAEEAVAGTEDLDAVAVAHERVVDFDGLVRGIEVDAVEMGVLAEDEEGVGGFVEVEEDEVGAVDE